jgi:hypothetical protein
MGALSARPPEAGYLGRPKGQAGSRRRRACRQRPRPSSDLPSLADVMIEVINDLRSTAEEIVEATGGWGPVRSGQRPISNALDRIEQARQQLVEGGR